MLRVSVLFEALPGFVGGAWVTTTYKPSGEKDVQVTLVTLDGADVDWEAVMGPLALETRRLLTRWALETHVREAYIWQTPEGPAIQVYREEESEYYLDEEWGPTHYPMPWDHGVSSYNTRPLEERVEYAISRYPVWYHNEAPKEYREGQTDKPTVEGVLYMGRLKDYWHKVEEPAVKKILRRKLGGEDVRSSAFAGA